MGNSPLVTYTCLSPNHGGKRGQPIWIITPHCVVGQTDLPTLGNIFLPQSRKASSNYGVGRDGDVGMFVEECNHSWCSSSFWNDDRAITIETASDKEAPWAFNQKAYNGLVKLCVDICQRHGKNRLIWPETLEKLKQAESTRKSTDMYLSAHRWYSATGCPGDWFYELEPQFAQDVTTILGGSSDPVGPVDMLYRVRKDWRYSSTQIGAFRLLDNAKAMADKNPGYFVFDCEGRCVYPFSEYLARVSIHDLNIRSGAGTNYPIQRQIEPGIYTIVEEAKGDGASNWGRLKSGIGWVSLDYALRI